MDTADAAHGNLGRCRPLSPEPTSTTWPWPWSGGPTPGPATPSSSAGRGARAVSTSASARLSSASPTAGGSRSSSPGEPEDNPFLRRFLDRHGPGPHHLTFKVPDLASALDARSGRRASRRWAWTSPAPTGRRPSSIPARPPASWCSWPRPATRWESPPPEGFPTAHRGPPASLRAGRPTPSPTSTPALALFEGLLGGRRVAHGVAPDRTWEYVDLEWPGPPGLRLIAPASGHRDRAGAGADTPLGAWLGDLPGRVHHLAFAFTGHGARTPAPPRSLGTDVPGLLPDRWSGAGRSSPPTTSAHAWCCSVAAADAARERLRDVGRGEGPCRALR